LNCIELDGEAVIGSGMQIYKSKIDMSKSENAILVIFEIIIDKKGLKLFGNIIAGILLLKN